MSEPPSIETAYNTSSSSILVGWRNNQSSSNHISGYRVSYWEGNSSLSIHIVLCPEWNLSTVLTNLKPFTNYCLELSSFTNTTASNRSQCQYVTTDEAAPNASPQNLTARWINLTSIRVTWDPLPLINRRGIILGYRVFYKKVTNTKRKKRSSDSSDKDTTVNALMKDLVGLEKSANYCVWVEAYNSKGSGNKTSHICVNASEDVPSGAPKLEAEKFFSPNAIKLTWQLSTEDPFRGIIIKYKINVTQTRNADKPPTDPWNKLIDISNSSETSFILVNLSLFSTYGAQISACTIAGCGNYSNTVFAETCRCPKYLSASKSQSSLDQGGNDSKSIADIIANTVTKSCGYCQEHNETVLVFSNKTDEESNLQFPVTRTGARGSEFSKFISVLEVPGVLVVKRQDNGSSRFYEEIMTGSVFDIWPVFVVSLLTVYSAGVLAWFLDREEQSSSFVAGVYEGFWWSFITMTTVGYGDRCPKSKPARAFAIVWLLISIVLLSFIMAAMSSTLTATVVRSQKKDFNIDRNSKAAAVANSPEYKLAVGSLSAKLKLTTNYSSVERLIRALKEGEVDYILVDMYLPVKRKDLFNGSWFEIAALYKAEISHGILLRGDALKLASALEEMIAYDNVQTNFLKNSNDDKGAAESTSNEYLFFDPASPFYKQIIFAGLGILCIFTVCGLVYQMVYTINRKCQTSEQETERDEIQRELQNLVDEFYRSLRQKYERLKNMHKKELLKVARQARNELEACAEKRNEAMVP